MFNPAQRTLLILCGVIIAIGLVVLGIDRFIIKRDQPPLDARRSARAAELGMIDLTPDHAGLDALHERLAPFAGVLGELHRIDAAWSRPLDAWKVWLAETTVTPIGQPDRTTRFLVLFEGPAPLDLPAWVQDAAPPPQPPFTEAAIARLTPLAAYQLIASGNRALFVARSNRPAVLEAIQRNQSDEFLPGLLHSALPVDIQAMVNLLNALDTGASPLSAFHRIAVEVNLPPVRPTGISNRLAEIRRELDATLASNRAAQAEADAARRAAFEASLEKFRESTQRPPADPAP
jgi:hypothetical protein